jgi:hypothetical protein
MMLRNLILLVLLSAALLAAGVVTGEETDTIPAGTKLDIRLKTKLSTKHNRSGDLFTGEIEHPVLSGNVEIVPAGSAVNGHIEKVQPAGHDHRASMRLVIDTIAGRSGMVYKLSPEIQRLTVVRSSGYKPGDAAPGGGAPGAQGAKQAPPIPQGGDLPPGARVVLVPRYKEAILKPGAELTFLLKQSVTATKPPTTE